MANGTSNEGLKPITVRAGVYDYQINNKENPTHIPPENSKKVKSLDPRNINKIILQLEGEWSKNKGKSQEDSGMTM